MLILLSQPEQKHLEKKLIIPLLAPAPSDVMTGTRLVSTFP